MGLAPFVAPARSTAVKAPERSVTVSARTLKAVAEVNSRLTSATTLSDALLFEKDPFPGAVPRKVGDPIRQAHRDSRAFVFDRAASYRVGELVSRSPEMIADAQEFARAPFPRTWIEMDADALVQAMQDAGLATHREDVGRDDRLGFLFTERGIYTAAGGPTDKGYHVGWSPMAYRPHQPMTAEQEREICRAFGLSRMFIDQWLWGSSYAKLDPSRRRSLRAQHGMDFLFPPGTIPDGGLEPLTRGGGAGDFRVALCALLLLLRPNMTRTVEERGAGRKMIGNKPTRFLAHTVVTVRLTADYSRRRITAAAKEERGRASCRWHDVRGHYVHNRAAKESACIHDWAEREPKRWDCLKGCGGKRAWREYPDGRGTAQVGVVTKHYLVTK